MAEAIYVRSDDPEMDLFRINGLFTERPHAQNLYRSTDRQEGPNRRYVALHGLRLACGLIEHGRQWLYTNGSLTAHADPAEAQADAMAYSAVRLDTLRAGCRIPSAQAVMPFTVHDLEALERAMPLYAPLPGELRAEGLVAEVRPEWRQEGAPGDPEHGRLHLQEALTRHSFMRLASLVDVQIPYPS